jgi:hypothetical protein
MRGALHLLCTIMLLPYLLLAAWFLILGDAIAGGSLAAFFTTLLAHALWLIPWGFLGLAAGIITVAALGVIDGVRWIGGLCLFFLAGGCLFVVIALNSSPIGPGQLLFLLPCFAILVFGGWLAIAELRPRRPRGGLV